MIASIRSGMELGFGVAELSTPLPRFIGGVLSSLGVWLSLPFTRLTRWIGYTIWVLLVAKLLGGRATAAQALGATALYAVPHVLDILDKDPKRALKKMKERDAIYKSLPGIDCGACGAPKCRSFAEDVVQGRANLYECVLIKEKKQEQEEMSDIIEDAEKIKLILSKIDSQILRKVE